jgi:recombinational DNA repair protein (RecF pathway)
MSVTRVHHVPAFVMHCIPWRETSLIVELFSLTHGRITAVAKGAKRRGSNLRGVLQQFAPLSVSFSGKNDVKTLTQADWMGGIAPLSGDGLMCGFYLNELILRLTAPADPHPNLYNAYTHALEALSHLSTSAHTEAVLRRFEWALLQEIGLAPSPFFDVDQQPIQVDSHYECWADRGFTKLHHHPLNHLENKHITNQHNSIHTLQGGNSTTKEIAQNVQALLTQKSAGAINYAETTHQPIIRGHTLQQLAHGALVSDPACLRDCKRLMRYLLRHHLGGKTLRTRELMIALAHLF